MVWEAKASDGSDKAAARVLAAEFEEEVLVGMLAVIGEAGGVPSPCSVTAVGVVCPCLDGCFRSCRALASAFSCVRTKWARCYEGSKSASESVPANPSSSLSLRCLA